MYICSIKNIKIMAQVSMTVRLDSQLKQQFNELCNDIGMSVNTAINVFVNAAVKTRGIPFEIKATQKSAREDFQKAFNALRESARKNGLQDMTLEEINEEIRQARLERAEREKKSL